MVTNKNQNIIIKTLVITTSTITMGIASNTFAAWDNNMPIAANIADFVSTAQGQEPQEAQDLKTKIQTIRNTLIQTVSTPTTTLADTTTADSGTQYTVQPKHFFRDIKNHQHAEAINILASHNIVQGNNGKFYPDNHVRLGDISKILIDTHAMLVDTTKEKLSAQQYLQQAYDRGLLMNVTSGGVQIGDEDTLVTMAMTQKIIANIIQQYPNLIKDFNVFPAKEGILTKADIASIVVELFGLQRKADALPTQFFNDITNTPAQEAINTLAYLDIVQAADKFYPENYVRRYDAIIMIVKAALVSDGKNPERTDTTQDFADVDTQASYAPYVAYAQQQKWLDYLTITTKEQTFIQPTDMITKDEVYNLLKKASQATIITDTANASQHITRAEFAQILVEAFDLQIPTAT